MKSLHRTDLKEESKRTWGNSPAGTTHSLNHQPGTKEFFEEAIKKRSEYEMPWLEDFFKFTSTKGKSVLEIGSGVGFDAYSFIKAGANYRGVDITPENIGRATKHMALMNLEGTFTEGDVENLKAPLNHYDIVFSNGVLHHTPDIETAFKKLHMSLKTGGEIWITVYNRNSIFFWFHLFLGEWICRRQFLKMSLSQRVSKIEYNSLDTTPLVNLYSSSEIKNLLEKNGFKVYDLAIRKLNKEDFPTFRPLRLIFESLPQKFVNALSKKFGWYICVKAKKNI